MSHELRKQIGEDDALLDGGNQRVETQRLAQSEQIQAADAERYARCETGAAGGIVQSGDSAPDASDLRPDSDGKGVAARLIHLEQDVLPFFVAAWILNRGLHLRKNAQVVKLLLAGRDALLRQRIARFQADAIVRQRRSGGLQAAQQHTAHINPFAQLQSVLQVHPVRAFTRRLRPIEPRVRISIVVVVFQDRIAIDGDIRLTERLIGAGLQDRAQIRNIVLRHAFKIQLTDERLRPFLHLQHHAQLPVFSVVIRIHLRFNVGLAKPVGAVKLPQRLLVALQQFLRITAVAEAEETRRRDVDAFAQRRGAEKLVPRDLDALQLVTLVSLDAVVDLIHVRRRPFFIEVHRGVEVALRLEIFDQIALPFDKQRAVYRALLIHRNQLPQLAARHLGPGCLHFDHGSVLDVDGGRQAVGIGVVVELFQCHLRFQVIALLKILAHARQAGGDAVLRRIAPAGKGQEQQSAPPVRGLDDALRRPRKLAGQSHVVEPRPVAGLNVEVDGGFFGGRIAIHLVVDFRVVESVGAHPLHHVLHRLLHIVVGEWHSQFKLGCSGQLSAIWRFRHAVQRHAAHEIGKLGRDVQHQRRALADRADRNVGEAAGLIQVLDSGVNVAKLQRRAGVHRHQLVQLIARQRLIQGIEIDATDRAAFVRTRGWCVLSERDANQEREKQWHQRTHDSQ